MNKNEIPSIEDEENKKYIHIENNIIEPIKFEIDKNDWTKNKNEEYFFE